MHTLPHIVDTLLALRIHGFSVLIDSPVISRIYQYDRHCPRLCVFVSNVCMHEQPLTSEYLVYLYRRLYHLVVNM
jgi:hypothetical protein